MSFPSAALLLCLWLSSAIAYKLPLLNEATLLTDDNPINKPNPSPLGITYKWEWQSQDRMDEGTLVLARLRRDTNKSPYKGDANPYGKILPTDKPTKPPLDEPSDSTPYILKASSASFTKAKKLPLVNEDETTTLTDPDQKTKGAGQKIDEDETTASIVTEQTTKAAKATHLIDPEHTTKGAGQTPDEDKTTTLTDLAQTSMEAGQEFIGETTHVGKSVTQLKTMATKSPLNPTTSEKLSVLTIDKYKTVHSTKSQDTSSQPASTDDKVLEDITFSLPPKAPETSPPLHDLTTGHDVTTVWFSSGSSAKPVAVTHIITTSSEDKVHTQSIMRQCMLTVLILAVVCTIFIISTVALAAKLSSMKQKSKLRHPVTYTEMRCISSLLPDDQQNKPQPKRLKTFAASMEESDGDNTTLNSFLPDH